jgi:hypothetical protein
LKLRALVCLGLALAAQAAMAEKIFETFPDSIESDGRYVIYSHGLIVEGDDPRPVHAEFGTYDFPAVKQAIFEGGNFNLIAHHRPANTDIATYVATLESWVTQLLDAGVKPSRVTLVGFSRGAMLTALASSKFVEQGINTALMGTCSNGFVIGQPDLKLGGHLLSIYETSDVVDSCGGLAEASAELYSFQEEAISTGLKHGAFFRPLPDWVRPLREWIAKTNR